MPKKVIVTPHLDLPHPEEEKYEKEGEKVTKIHPEDIEMEWEAPEYVVSERHPYWHFATLIIAGLLILYSLFTRNFLFVIIIVMFVIIYDIYGRRKPQLLNIAITKQGLKVNDKLYTFEDDLNSFWIFYRPPELKTLNFSRKQRFFPDLSFQLEKQNPLKVRELLLKYLPEDIEKEEHFMDKFARKIGI